MNTLIIGSGFGLYGYLPSIYKISKKIFLNIKYIEKINNRVELKKFLKKITWYNEKKLILNKIDYLIIAQNPQKQDLNLRKYINIYKPKHLFLEKPISNNPSNSIKLINFLQNKKIKFSVGFLFKYTVWHNYIQNRLTKDQKFKIIWDIRYNNENKKWKYVHSLGGGLLRFYCIHFIRIFYDLKFFKLNNILIKKSFCYFDLSDNNNNNIILEVKFSEADRFYIHYNKKVFYNSVNPFLRKIIKKKDPRLRVLNKYLNDQIKNSKMNYKYEKKFILFWDKLEKENGNKNS